MPIKTQSAKAKGRDLQKHIRKKLLEIFTVLEEDDVVSRPMGSGGTDLMLSPKAQRAVGISFEAKNTRKSPSVGELKQSKANAYPGSLPAVAWKPFGKGYDDTLVMFNLEEFLHYWRNRMERTEMGCWFFRWRRLHLCSRL